MEGTLKRAVIIGAGNVATHLASALENTAGIAIDTVWSRNIENASRIAAGLKSAVATDEISAIPRDADLYLIAVSDDAIADIASSMPPVNGMVAHTSGTVPIDILAIVSCKGFGSFYPLQTFSKDRALDLANVPFFIEGNDEETAKALYGPAARISTRVIYADSSLRGKLHIAAVFASNFANALWGVADDILAETGLGLDILHPLLEETLSKAVLMGPDNAQTGPAKRNDQHTINSHLAKLTDPRLKELYSGLTNLIIARQCQK